MPVSETAVADRGGDARPAGRASLETLQIGRALAALAVVLFHTEVTLGHDKYLGRDLLPIFRSGDAGVDYFFVLSGFVMVTAHAADFGRAGVVLPFLWKRFRRLCPALWVVLAAQLVLVLVVPQQRIVVADLPWILVNDLLVLPWGGPTLLAVEWTLRHEVLFYLAFALALALPERRGLVVGAALATIAAGLLVALPAPFDRLASAHNLLFGFGIVAAVVHRRGALPRPRLVLGCGLALFAGNWLGLAFDLWGKSIVTIWLYGLGAACAVAAAARLEVGSGFRAPAALRLLGDASYAVYLVHFPVVSAASKLVTRLDALHPLPDALAFAAVAAPAVAAGVVFHLTIEKPLLARLPTRLAAPPVGSSPSRRGA